MAESGAPIEGEAAELATSLELIAEMTQDFARSGDAGAALGRALERITRHVGAEAGSLFLLDAAGEELVCEASIGPVDIRGLRLPAGEGIVGRTVRCNACELVRDVRHDPQFQGSVDAHTGFSTRSVLCASLSVRERSLGAIELVNKRGGRLFDDHDRRLLRALGAAAGLALQNARLALDLVDQERVRREVELAAEIQRNLLPERRPPPFPVCGVNVAARRVSGDFYDYLPLSDGRIAFTIGDVSGKGINAALLMAKTASLYRCLAKSAPGPGPLLGRINREICDTATRGMFVTMLAGLYDPATRRVRLANAGHEPPLVRRPDGAFDPIPAEAPPVGIAPEIVGPEGYPEAEVSLVGATLYAFTDGLTEGRLGGRTLGVEGVVELLRRFESRPPGERIDAVVEEIAKDPLRDDLTLLVLEARE